MKQAIRKHLRDFVAVVALAVIGLLAAGYVLSHQRFYLPAWVPLLGSDFVDYKATFTTAQSVTPGQGQTVQIAGVDVGDLTNVALVDGRAVVTMKIRRKYAPIYKDATALLRPKTGLNDMIVQLTPGSKSAGEAPAGWAIPVERTLPYVNTDEILSALDADTRDYLQLLVAGAGEGLKGDGRPLAATLKRFEPLGRDVARLNGALAERRRNIRRSIHNFRLVAQALGGKDDELATLVDASNRVFASFARQDRNLRATLRELPGTLRATDSALGKADDLGRVLGPTLGGLRPAARALGPSLRQTRPFLRTTTPIVRDQLRPFARDVLPVVKVLRPAAKGLAQVTPELASSLTTLNRALNALAYNPPGSEEGYLFWTAWAGHNGDALFDAQDAHGPVRRGLVMATCTTLRVLPNLKKDSPVLGTAADLLNAPDPDRICPGGSSLLPAAASARSTGEAKP